MTLVTQAVLTVLTLVLLFGLYRLVSIAINAYKHRQKTRPAQVKNRKKEKQFIENVLADIRTNSDDWFLMDDVTSNIGSNSILANDKKNIGIVYHSSSSTMTVLLNLDDLQEFDKVAADTVKLTVTGEHVKNFLRKAEDVIDRRGREIDYFRDELGKRL